MGKPIRQALRPATTSLLADLFDRLDYHTLGSLYCDHGGRDFWDDRRFPCQRLGIKIASYLKPRLKPKGHSLYVGAGVAELPMLMMETTELRRSVSVHNLRKEECAVLNTACKDLPFTFRATPAQYARGRFDHIWIVSVLNDPELYPETSALSYGRANPFTFEPDTFKKERRILGRLVTSCLGKLALPGMVTTSIEEIPWITAWCLKHGFSFQVAEQTLPTAIVGDPVCFIHIGEGTVHNPKRSKTKH